MDEQVQVLVLEGGGGGGGGGEEHLLVGEEVLVWESEGEGKKVEEFQALQQPHYYSLLGAGKAALMPTRL